ncbi:ergothioneine biosynthesis protein EgtB [Chryseobacterium sp. POE27]|uniref:ergothioneine biosynthesis protein EgtB n=1 Tax=Chryseobacterium sp. POE27 TaxID=3138177 RepID=UPI00321B6710
METDTIINSLVKRFKEIRMHSEEICKPLEIEDYVVQPIVDVSPPKWHLGHTTWFFETFILIAYDPSYEVFDPQYNFVFNSYYETIGARVIRTDRGNLSRPSVSDVYRYRKYVDEKMADFLNSDHINGSIVILLELGLNHEQQHQELLMTDIKYILGHNPLFPVYKNKCEKENKIAAEKTMLRFLEGIYEVGFEGSGFCFDNELTRHKVYLNDFEISNRLVTNADYLEFMEAGGYEDFRYWHADGWSWVKENNIKSPLYWHKIDDQWMHYTLNGSKEIDPEEELCHISFYEASAYASWKEMRLPTEQEWEVASPHFEWGKRWEWTNSAYLPYPGFKKEPGAVGEYNGKFMINQMFLRGASVATPHGHSRNTYRNFFQPELKWQFTGIRLAK